MLQSSAWCRFGRQRQNIVLFYVDIFEVVLTSMQRAQPLDLMFSTISVVSVTVSVHAKKQLPSSARYAALVAVEHVAKSWFQTVQYVASHPLNIVRLLL